MVSIAGKCRHARLSSCPFVTDSVQLSRMSVDLFNPCACEFVCVCAHKPVHVEVGACVCVCVHAHMYVQVGSWVCVCVCVCVSLYSLEVRSIAVCGGTLLSGINMKS